MGHDHDENRSGGKFQSVLFVCTGNIFRSVTAEYALKIRLGGGYILRRRLGRDRHQAPAGT